MKIVSFFFAIFLVSSCGNVGDETVITYIDKQSEENLKVLFGSSMSLMEVEVVYEPGAEPYVGNRLNGKPYWNLFETNIKEVFKQREGEYTLVVPKTLAEMRQIPNQSKSSWSVADLQALEKTHRTTVHSGTQASLFIAFLDGYMEHEGSANPNIIGVSVAGSTMIAIFKDVIKGVAQTSSTTTAKFMEQSTLVHEFGHTVGLVDNGVAMSSNHKDEEHGHHCNNSDCVMFWKNEGKSDLILFVQQIMLSGNSVMFDQNCLNDTKNYSP
tara:strand:+ start:5405 stop:6211 length:807 start_codon:yes stop_codon:yes gene_type:complete